MQRTLGLVFGEEVYERCAHPEASQRRAALVEMMEERLRESCEWVRAIELVPAGGSVLRSSCGPRTAESPSSAGKVRKRGSSSFRCVEPIFRVDSSCIRKICAGTSEIWSRLFRMAIEISSNGGYGESVRLDGVDADSFVHEIENPSRDERRLSHLVRSDEAFDRFVSSDPISELPSSK